MRFLPSTPNPLVWPILLCAAAATYAAGVHLGFSPPGKDILHVVYFTAALLTAASVSHFVLKMPAASEPLALCAFWCGMAIILLPATYIAAAFNMPLMDEAFSALDTAVGFNWRALQSLVAGDVTLSWVAFVIYRYSILQVLIAVIALAATRDLLRLNTYATGLLLATIAMVVISALLPAFGTYVHYGLTTTEMGHILDNIPLSSHVKDLTALRNGTLRNLDVQWDGIVTFPSYHAIIAITAGWASWRVRWIGGVNAVLTLLVLVATLPYGAHYLTDLGGAALVTAVSLSIADDIERRRLHAAVPVVAADVSYDEPAIVWTRTSSNLLAIVLAFASWRIGILMRWPLRGGSRLTGRTN